MKMYEAAKKFGMKSHEFRALMQEYDLELNSNQNLSDDEMKRVEEVMVELDDDKELKELRKIVCVGMYFNEETRKYAPITFDITKDDFDKLNVKTHVAHRTVYNARSDLAQIMDNGFFFNTNPLELFIQKRRRNGKK